MSILKEKGKKKNLIIFLTPLLLFLLFSPVLFAESVEKTLIIFLFFSFWLGLFLYTENIALSSLLLLLIVFPFNITFQLPLVLKVFNTTFSLAQPFVDGIYVNYLVPTLSILDVGIFLFLFTVLIQRGFSFFHNILRDFKNGILIFFSFLVIQNTVLFTVNSFILSLRLFSLLLVILVGIGILREKKFEEKKALTAVLVISLFHVIFQGILGILQFRNGSHLGLSFLGESKVIGGMAGSSFVELSGQLFLRAYGTFPHPNILAGFFLLSIFTGLFFLRRKKVLSLFFIGFSLFFLVFTFSRIGILLGTLVSFLFLMKKIFWKSKEGKTVNNIAPILFLERFNNLFEKGDRSWIERLVLLGKGVTVFKKNWFLGTGLGNFVKGMEGFVPRTFKGVLLTQPVHNVFLLILSELGVFGFLSLFFVLVQVLIKNWKKVTLFNFLLIFSLLVISLFDHYLFSLPQGMVLGGIFFIQCCLYEEDLN